MKLRFKVEYLVLPILFSLIAYLASNSFIVTGIVLILSLIYFFLVYDRRLYKYIEQHNRFDSCYNFINNFLITIDSKQTLVLTLESVISIMDDGLKEEYQGIIHLEEFERLEYLRKYYPFYVYDLFINVVKLYTDRGGNILDMSKFLLTELRNEQDYNHEYYSLGKRKIFDFSILWFFSLIVLVVLRFALSQYYSMIANQLFYKIMVVFLFIFILISIEVINIKTHHFEKRGADYEQAS